MGRSLAVACAVGFTVAGFAATSWATNLSPGANAVTIQQVDFRSGDNSMIAELTLDRAAAQAATGFSSGYVNVVDSLGNWVVRNMPMYDAATYDHPSVTTSFALNVPDGIDISNANFDINYTPAPLLGFGGPASSNFGIGNVQSAVGGFIGSVFGFKPPPDPATLAFNAGGANSIVYQKRHPNVQCADDQCAPMAVANSLQWLENEQGINVPHNHVKGLKGDNSLVGKLDSAMNRGVRSRTDGDPVNAMPILTGKLDYVAGNGLMNQVVTKHQGLLGGGNVTSSGVTSTGQGAAIDIDWIISELAHGEDVEMGFIYPGDGGHFVDITGAGRILGVPWITYVSDHVQSDRDTDSLVTPNIDETDTLGCDQVDFSFLMGNTLVNEKGKPAMAFVISQSKIPEPATMSMVALVGGVALIRRRR